MVTQSLARLGEDIGRLERRRKVGRVTRASHGVLELGGLADAAALGDQVEIEAAHGRLPAEIVDLSRDAVVALVDGEGEGLRLGDAALLDGPPLLAVDDGWLGRIVDPHGQPLDARPLPRGRSPRPIRAPAPAAARRRPLGARLSTGLAVFDTLLPIVRGQRLGLFAGSGVGKSTLVGKLAERVEADVVVVALVGERGREVREFAEALLARSERPAVVVAATSDRPPLTRRRALWSAMTVAEHFRDRGKHVLMLADSVTRFAEAHREVALASGEAPALRGFPPSVLHHMTALTERAGPGPEASAGDITALFTVLVAGSDMEEPVADIMRGVLDGHVVLDRAIAERGRFPAVDPLRSVSRSLPACASAEENMLISVARRLLGAYDRAEMMIQAGLYVAGSDADVDAAIAALPALERFLAAETEGGVANAFASLAAALPARALR